MQSTRKLSLLFFCLLSLSLACLSTTEPFVTYPADTPTPIQATVKAMSSPSPVPSPTGRGNLCAIISADEALHMRTQASATSQVLAFMERGEVVTLISSTNAEWWLIKRGDLVGYARAKYLEKSEC